MLPEQDSSQPKRRCTTSLADGLPIDKYLRTALSDFSPERQPDYAAFPIRAVEDSSDTLYEIAEVYGLKAVRFIIIPHITDLLVFLSQKNNAMTEQSIIQCADVITQSFPLLRLPELMLFFHRFKSGAFGQLYGGITPLDITCSLRRFMPYLYDLRERSEWRKREREREERARQAVSYRRIKKSLHDE